MRQLPVSDIDDFQVGVAARGVLLGLAGQNGEHEYLNCRPCSVCVTKLAEEKGREANLKEQARTSNIIARVLFDLRHNLKQKKSARRTIQGIALVLGVLTPERTSDAISISNGT